MTEPEMIAHLADIQRHDYACIATGEGVVYKSEEAARNYCAQHDADPVQIGAGWLTKSKNVSPSPMPTREGDVVIHHLHQRYSVWVVMADGAQQPDDNVAPQHYWSRAEAEGSATSWAETTHGRIIWLQTDGGWAISS